MAILVATLLIFLFTSTTAFAHSKKHHFDEDFSNYTSNGVYQETGVGTTKTINFYVCPEQFAVMGAFKYGGHTNGVYKVFGPGYYSETLTDGFVTVVPKSDAWKEWHYRLWLAKKNGWAATHLFNEALPR